MEFQECELEFAVDFAVEGKAGLNVWVLKLGAGAKRTEKNVIRVKYKALTGPNADKLVAPGLAEEGTLTPPVRQGQKVK